MKQRIEVCITTPSTSWKLNILSVHEVDGKLIVVSKAKRPGWAGDAISHASDARVVITSAQSELPVINYLTGVSKEEIEEDSHIGNYGIRSDMARYGGKTPSTFTPITDVSEIADLLAKGKCIYQPRTDGLAALRLGHFERQEAQPVMMVNDETAVLTPEQMQGVINIYPVVNNGTFKVVVENICEKQEKKSFEHLIRLVKSGLRDSNTGLDLEGEFFMTSDDIISFTALADGKPTKFTTHAIEFSLPEKDVGAITNFIRFLDCTIKASKKSEEYSQAYTHVQVSQHSILSKFDEIFTFNKKNNHGDDELTIMYPELFNIADFYQEAGTHHEPASTFKPLLGTLLKANLPAYASILPALQEIYPLEPAIVFFPLQLVGKILGEEITISTLRGDGNIEARIEIADRLATKLSNKETLDRVGSLLRAFTNNGVSEFCMKSINKKAHDGCTYNFNFTEFEFLFFAEYYVREDGRMSIKPESSVGYKKHYANGCRNYGIFEAEMRHLGNVVGLEFAEDSDFHREIIFTPECTLKLKALGLHLNQANLRKHLVHTDEVSVEASVPVNQIESKPEPTAQAILTSKTALALRSQYPQSNTILDALQKVGLLNDSAANIRNLFATLINACASFQETEKDNEKRESIDELLNLYRLLDATNDKPSLLTLKIHNQIIGSIVRANRCKKIAELAALVGPLDAQKAEKLILAGNELISIGEMLSIFDDTNESLLYLFNKLEDHRSIGGMMGFWDMLACQQIGEGLDWLRKEDFKIIVDNIKSGMSYQILSTLSNLHRANALESHRDRYLQNIDQHLPLHEMCMSNLLTKENIELAFMNPDFGLAERLCENYGFLGWRAKNYSGANDKLFKQALLATPELTLAIKLMHDIHGQYEESGKEISKEKCIEDLAQLLRASHAVKMPEPEKSNEVAELIKKGLSLFKSPEPRDLAECMLNLKKKYDYKEALIEDTVKIAAKM